MAFDPSQFLNTEDEDPKQTAEVQAVLAETGTHPIVETEIDEKIKTATREIAARLRTKTD